MHLKTLLALAVCCITITTTNVRAGIIPDSKFGDSVPLHLIPIQYNEKITDHNNHDLNNSHQLIRHKRQEPDQSNQPPSQIPKTDKTESNLKWITYLLICIIIVLTLLLLVAIISLLFWMIRCKPQPQETCREIQVQCCRCEECLNGNGCN